MGPPCWHSFPAYILESTKVCVVDVYKNNNNKNERLEGDGRRFWRAFVQSVSQRSRPADASKRRIPNERASKSAIFRLPWLVVLLFPRGPFVSAFSLTRIQRALSARPPIRPLNEVALARRGHNIPMRARACVYLFSFSISTRQFYLGFPVPSSKGAVTLFLPRPTFC